MSTLHVTSALIARVDHFSVRFHAARMGSLAALPGNPFGVEIRSFGEGVACKVRHPLLAGKNRIIGFRPSDLDMLDMLLRFYHDDHLPFTLSVPAGQTTLELFQRLVKAGMWSGGSGTVPALLPHGGLQDASLPLPSDISVRLSGPEERELYLDSFQQAFARHPENDPEYRAFQWAEDTLPGSARYLAESAGTPIAMASFLIVEGVGLCGTGGVLPAYRRRGVQMALIHQRIADAPALGCDLVLGGGRPGTTTYRNFERAGLRLIPTGSTWRKTDPTP